MAKTTKLEADLLLKVMEDPVLWAKVFITIYDSAKKAYTPWTARYYQANILHDKSLKRVLRCGRRTGKTETMCVDMLHKTSINKNFRALVITPYENQVQLIFARLKELIEGSPLIKSEVIKCTSSPYNITFKNNSCILGFTTGASSGNGAASVRGQKADALYIDEMDYLGENDFDTISTIAAERPDIYQLYSSTPTGKRSHFYLLCTDKKRGFNEHYYPSTCNPNWCPAMEAEFRAQLSEQGYIHEILAEFGEEEAGVFDKDKVDAAMRVECYHYLPLDILQKERCKNEGLKPANYCYSINKRAPFNLFRCVGVDFDKYQSSSSILVLDYDVQIRKFRIFKRYELPKSEYSYDNAFKAILEANEVYNPAWIYCDRGSGEYLIERLHIHGEEHPETGLKNKVKGFQFKNVLEIMDPITKEVEKKPMKPFMITQLATAFERDSIILSPFDETIYKQLIDYNVQRISQSGIPIYTSENEHFVDALALAYLAFVLEFPELTNIIKEIECSSTVNFVNNNSRMNRLFNDIQSPFENQSVEYDDNDDLKGDRDTFHRVPMNYRPSSYGGENAWGSRNPFRGKSAFKSGYGRSMW